MSILPSILKSLKALTVEVENAIAKSGKTAPVAAKIAPGKKAPPAAPKAPEKKTAPVAPGKKQPGKTAPAAAPVKKGAKTHGGLSLGQKVKATWDDGSSFIGTVDKLGEIGKFKGSVRVAFTSKDGEVDNIWFAPEEFGMLTLAKGGKKAPVVEEPEEEEEEIDEEANESEDEEESEESDDEDEQSDDEDESDEDGDEDEEGEESEDDESEDEEPEEDEEPAPKKTIVTKKNADAEVTKMMVENVKMAKVIDASSECAKHGCAKLIKSGSCTLKSVAECNRQLKAEVAKREKGGSKKPGKK